MGDSLYSYKYRTQDAKYTLFLIHTGARFKSAVYS